MFRASRNSMNSGTLPTLLLTHGPAEGVTGRIGWHQPTRKPQVMATIRHPAAQPDTGLRRLITRRSWVQIPPPPPRGAGQKGWSLRRGAASGAPSMTAPSSCAPTEAGRCAVHSPSRSSAIDSALTGSFAASQRTATRWLSASRISPSSAASSRLKVRGARARAANSWAWARPASSTSSAAWSARSAKTAPSRASAADWLADRPLVRATSGHREPGSPPSVGRSPPPPLAGRRDGESPIPPRQWRSRPSPPRWQAGRRTAR